VLSFKIFIFFLGLVLFSSLSKVLLGKILDIREEAWALRLLWMAWVDV